MKKYFPLFFLVFGLAWVGLKLIPKHTKSEFDLDGFGRLPVLANGRIKPMDTVGRNALLILQGRQAIYPPDRPALDGADWFMAVIKGQRSPFAPLPEPLTPTEWALDVFFRSEIADKFQHFEIVHPDVLSLFNLAPEDGDGKKRFSFAQLQKGLDELDRQTKLADSVDAQLRTPFQKAVVGLQEKVLTYQRLKYSLVMPDNPDFLSEITQFQANLPKGVEAARAKQAGKSADDAALKALAESNNRFEFMGRAGSLLAVPPSDPSTPDAWQNVGQSLLGTFQNGNVEAGALVYAGLAHAWRLQQAEQFNKIIELYRAELVHRFASQLKKTEVEIRFNAAEPFYVSMLLYVLAFIVAIISWLKWPETLAKSAYYLIIVAWLTTTVGILTRMWLEGRPPVTNLYSSALFVGWGSVGLCIVLEAAYKNAIGSAAAGIVGFCTLLIAHHLALGGDTLEMMRAVLDSNFWLATHVVIVTTGYAATFLSGFLAIIYIFRGVFTRSLDKATADSLGRMVYGIVCFATLFSLVGTVLGGIWADQSWGRFWGWDPKENGALIIVLWNAIILHARWGGLVKTRGIMALAVFGNIVTSWSWFGVNMLGIGLHSYGFMDAAFWWLIAFVASQLAIIAIALIPLENWRSFKKPALPLTPRPLAAKTAR